MKFILPALLLLLSFIALAGQKNALPVEAFASLKAFSQL
jgi:hypothetical protein